MKVTTKQIGPGMIQQMQSPCDACGSQGEVISEAHKCGSCKGKKTMKDKKIIEVLILYFKMTYISCLFICFSICNFSFVIS